MKLSGRYLLGTAFAGVLSLLMLQPAFAAPPDGKSGGGDEGSTEEPASLPADLDVRYRVQFIPIPADSVGFYTRDINDVNKVIGYYAFSTGASNADIGFYYDAATKQFLRADEMIALEAPWIGTQFVGINNKGGIVGSAVDADGLRCGIMIYPDGSGSWSYELLPPPIDNCYEFYACRMNDYGDIVGVYWQANEDGTRGTGEAFAVNFGTYPPRSLTLPYTPFYLDALSCSAIAVTNTRQGIAYNGQTSDNSDSYKSFDFINKTFSPIVIPQPSTFDFDRWGLGQHQPGISNDGQLPVNTMKKVSNKMGGEYSYTPGVLLGDALLWKGPTYSDRMNISVVNSIAASSITGEMNTVGDALLGWDGRWHLEHADWGYLDLESLLMFDDEVDQTLWSSDVPSPYDMSDRDSRTGFGLIAGDHRGANMGFVLVPQLVAP